MPQSNTATCIDEKEQKREIEEQSSEQSMSEWADKTARKAVELKMKANKFILNSVEGKLYFPTKIVLQGPLHSIIYALDVVKERNKLVELFKTKGLNREQAYEQANIFVPYLGSAFATLQLASAWSGGAAGAAAGSVAGRVGSLIGGASVSAGAVYASEKIFDNHFRPALLNYLIPEIVQEHYPEKAVKNFDEYITLIKTADKPKIDASFAKNTQLLIQEAEAKQIEAKTKAKSFVEKTTKIGEDSKNTSYSYQDQDGEIEKTPLLDDYLLVISDQVAETSEMIKVIFDSYTNAAIHGFESNLEIVELHQKLTQLKTRQQQGESDLETQINKTVIELNQKKAIITAERENFTYELNRKKQIAHGVTQVLGIVNPELAQQIDVVGQSTFSIYENGAALLGVGVLAGSIHPLLALGNIATGVKNLVQLFDKKQEANPTGEILNAIQELSKFINSLFMRQELKLNELAHQIDKNQWAILEKFRQLENESLDMASLLRLIYFEIRHNFSNQNMRITQIIDLLNSLQNKMNGHNEVLDELQKLLRFILNNNQLEYNKLANDMDHISLQKSITTQMADPILLPPNSSSASYFELASYYATLITSKPSQIPNPLIVAYAALGNIILALKEHPLRNSQNSRERIAIKDIQRLEVYQELLDSLVQLMKQARDEELIKKVVDNYQVAATELAKQIKLYTTECENQYTQDITIQMDEAFAEERQDDLRRFNQPLTINTREWFKGQRIHECRRHHGDHWSFKEKSYAYTHENDANGIQGMQTYVREREKAIEQQREEYRLSARQRLIEGKNNHIFLYDAPRLSTSYGVQFIHPENIEFPTLPAPDTLLPSEHPFIPFLTTLQKAQAIGLGYIQLTYNINDSLFIINVGFKLTSSNNYLSVFSATLPYTPVPSFFKGSEAIWNYWVGGNLPLNEKGESKEFRVGITWDQAIAGQGWGHKNGQFDADVYYFHIPSDYKKTEGKLQTFSKFTEVVFSGVKEKNLQMLEHAYEEKLQQLQKLYKKEKATALDPMHQDELGKACQAFARAYHHLYGVLTFGYYELMQDPNSSLARWFAIHGITLEDLRRGDYKEAPWQTLNTLQVSLVELQELIQQVDNTLSPMELLKETHTALSTFLELYKPFAVETNKNVETVAQMDQSAQVLASLVTSMAQGFLAYLPEEQALQAVTVISTQWEQQLNGLDERVRNSVLARIQQEASRNNLLPSLPAGRSILLELPKGESIRKEESPTEKIKEECAQLPEEAKDKQIADAQALCSHIFGVPATVATRPRSELQTICQEHIPESSLQQSGSVLQLLGRLCNTLSTGAPLPNSPVAKGNSIKP